MSNNLKVSLVALAAIAALGCDRSESESMALNPGDEAPTAPATGGLATHQQPGAPPGEVPPTVAAATAVAPLENNLARNFQGEFVAEIIRRGQAQPATFRYASHSEKLRMQLQGTSKDFDVLARDDRLHVLDHDNDRYRSFDLSEMDSKAEFENVPSKISGEMGRIEGVNCEKRTMQAEGLRIEMCVGAIPGKFELGVFEKATGVEAPDWLATLIEDSFIPLTATAYTEDGQEAFSMKVTKYSPNPAPAALFELPSTYQAMKQ